MRSANPGDPLTLYLDAHGQADADTYHELVLQYGQRMRVVGTYAAAMIKRYAMLFNTAVIPECTLVKATLRAWITK
ncbi:unnamed protein product, partial [marine sediment metagenome]